LKHSSRRRADDPSMGFDPRGCPSGANAPSLGLGRSTAAQPGVRRVQHCWPFVTSRTLIGGSAHQTQ
jgi:hypothetical protein